MGLFDGVNNASNVEKEQDVVRGAKRQPLDSAVYDFVIKYVYAEKAKSGALGINVTLKTADEKEIRIKEWVTSGDAKGNKTYYEKTVDGKTTQHHLPGFIMIDSLCELAVGKGLLACANEKKHLKLYNYEAKTEVATEVDMLVELIGKPIKATVLRQVQDKTKKNDASGEYEPTGETFETNVIDKFLDPTTGKTASERKNGIEADYVKLWSDKWAGKIDNQAKGTANAGTAGTPAAGQAAPKAPLFG